LRCTREEKSVQLIAVGYFAKGYRAGHRAAEIS